MADHIDLTKDSDDERDERQSTFESDAALARKLSAELNGEAPKNNKRTIDLTADSQEEPPPRPAQRARTDAVSIKEMKETIKRAGLPTKDLIDKPGTETRYAEALARLAERAERDAAAARARRVTLAPTPAAAPGSRVLSFVLRNSGGRLTASWADGEPMAPQRGFTRQWQDRRVVKLKTHLKAPGTAATVYMAYDADGARGEPWQRSPMAYRQSGCQANGATLMKSQFQKAVRRRLPDVAAKAFRELLTFPKSGGLFVALRRLLIVSCEDSAPLDGINSVLVWFFAAQGYAPTEADVAFILGAAAAVADCPRGPTKKDIPGFDWKKAQAGERKEYLAEVPLAGVSDGSRRALDFLFALASSGKDGWDGELLLAAASWFTAHEYAPAAHFAPRPQASLGRLRPEECILAAVDAEVGAYRKKRAPIFDVMEQVDPAMKRVKFDGEGGLQKWMGITRQFVRARKSYTPKDDHPEWTRVADEAARRLIAAAVVSNPPW